MSKEKGVPCPNCNSRNTGVSGTVTCDSGVKRYRGCGTCEARFVTVELSQQTWDRKTAMITRGIGEMRAYLDDVAQTMTCDGEPE